LTDVEQNVNIRIAFQFLVRFIMKSVIDLFCGAGGLSEGFRQAGYKVLAGNDFNEVAGETFSATHGGAVFIPGPVQSVSAARLLKDTGLRKGQLDCLIGGPPCQGFSVYNHQRGMHDHRSQLFLEYLRLVEQLNPRWIVMENVTGMLSAGGGEAVTAIKSGLAELGFNVEAKVLKAEEYGVPQERRRLVFIGNRIGAPIVWPIATHGTGKIPYVTIREAIGDLPKLANGQSISPSPYSKKASSEFQRMLRERSLQVLNHSAPKLAKVNIERMQYIPPGGSWRDIPVHLLPEGMKKARRCDHTKRYGRMRWDGLSCTILTKCDVHWGAFIHPDQDRAISVREAARIQSFPDWFQFQGSQTDQYMQIGNAVPPLVGRQIAEAILRADLTSSKRQTGTRLQVLVDANI
jgi:DNA (cytosine-5)-methyltransferase 1